MRPASASLLYARHGHQVGPLLAGYTRNPLPAGATQAMGQARPAHSAGNQASSQAAASSGTAGGTANGSNGATAAGSGTTSPATSSSTASSSGGSGSASSSAGSGTGTAGTKATVTCSGSGGMLPANYATIVGFLMSHGYTGVAAAGIAGNIYQESGGNPESIGSGGGGLIGWTPLPGGYVTGNSAADLQTQLSAVLSFNQNWAQYIPALNAASTPAQAADIYVTDFERAGIPAASNREAAAQAVAAACGL